MRWMLFADGENFTIRGQYVAKEARLTLAEGEWYKAGTFLWIPNRTGCANIHAFGAMGWDSFALRAMYYTRVAGSEEAMRVTKNALRKMGFEPHVSKKNGAGQKPRAVDVDLTKDMFAHAFRHEYEAAVLVAGDGGYVPIVNEVKRLGKKVLVSFFGAEGMNADLKLAGDHSNELDEVFLKQWTGAQ